VTGITRGGRLRAGAVSAVVPLPARRRRGPVVDVGTRQRWRGGDPVLSAAPRRWAVTADGQSMTRRDVDAPA
jgi:hypothetical protein